MFFFPEFCCNQLKKENLQDVRKEMKCLRYAFCKTEEAILLGSLIGAISGES